MYKHFRSYREVRISIIHTMYRDGVFYIVCIARKRNCHLYGRAIYLQRAVITSANILVNAIFPVSIVLPYHASTKGSQGLSPVAIQ